ncbi:hypothetical protein [Chitinophaga qingshengii]|uniref:Uncharacterized protein n=1 Tax=Chitinophaga qingshengii TaxID=1569794 RepID=A0ABR7TU40_9BACT|nr:hypothetical protein [Chitinophaga qingshengii]MBC9932966.1 hypothetical protein [Chitinophaga qingshengii]
MAIDGIKIIDSDTAHDAYWGIMDMYDNGVAIPDIETAYPLDNEAYQSDALDFELYVTACGLAFWEMGLMDAGKLAFIRSIIDKGAFVQAWGEGGKARQKELDRYWKKISQPNGKIRAPKKYRKVSRFYFQQNDLLAFRLDDGHYMAVVCAEIFQQRGTCEYMLVPTTYYGKKLPTEEDLHRCDMLGNTILSFYDKATTSSMQPGIERIWQYLGGDVNVFFGLAKYGLLHKDAATCRQQLTKVGTLKVIESLNDTAIRGALSGFDYMKKYFYGLVFPPEGKKSVLRWPVNLICHID